jgi:hypothetical protein
MKLADDRSPVVVVESRLDGFQHGDFNAALLHTVRLAYPETAVLFLGETTQLEFVKEKLERTKCLDSIEFEPIRIPASSLSGWNRLSADFASCAALLRIFARRPSRAVVFCSVTAPFVLALKILMWAKRFTVPTIAILHGEFSVIATRPITKRLKWIEQRGAYAFPQPANLRLIVLGDSILNNLKRCIPVKNSQWASFYLPYLRPYVELGRAGLTEPDHRHLRFGFVGMSGHTGDKGFDTFVRLANAIAPESEACEFVIVGYYNGPADGKPVCPFLRRIPDRPLSQEEFDVGMLELTYVVWTADPQHYRLTSSATFVDALTYLKPGIYLRNDYIEHYFDRMGDIGYLCDTYEDMLATIREIVAEFPKERYAQQVENIRKGCVILEPETIAPRLRQILDSCGPNLKG